MSNRLKAKNDNKNPFEMAGIVVIITSAAMLACLIYPDTLSIIGHGIYKLLTGAMGIFAYAFLTATLLGGIFMVRRYRLVVSKKRLAYIIALSLTGLIVLQLVTSHRLLALSFGDYLKNVYNFSGNVTAAGVLGGIVAYAAKAALTTVGAYVVFCLAFAAFAVAISFDISYSRRPIGENRRNYKKQQSFTKGNSVAAPVKPVTNNGLFIENIIPKERRTQVEGGTFSSLTNSKNKSEVVTSERGNLHKFGNEDALDSIKKEEEDTASANARSILFGNYDKMLEESASRFIKRNVETPKTITAAPITNYAGAAAYSPVELGVAYSYATVGEESSKKSQSTLPEVVFHPLVDPIPENPIGIINAEEFSSSLKGTAAYSQKSEQRNFFAHSDTKEAQFYDEKYNYADKDEQVKKFLSDAVPFAAATAPFIKNSNDIIDCDSYQDAVAACDKSVVSFKGDINNVCAPPYSVSTIEYVDENVFDVAQETSSSGYKTEPYHQDDYEPYEPFAQYIQELSRDDDTETEKPYEFLDDESFKETPLALAQETVLSKNELDGIEQLLTDEEYYSGSTTDYDFKELYGDVNESTPFSAQVVDDSYNFVSDADLNEEKKPVTLNDPVGKSFLERVEKLERAKSTLQDKPKLDFFCFDDVNEEDEPVAAVEPIKTQNTKNTDIQPQQEEIKKEELVQEAKPTQNNVAYERMQAAIKEAKSARQAKSETDQINIDGYLRTANSDEKPRSVLKSSKYNPPPVSLLTGESTDPNAYGEDCENSAMMLEETLKNLKLPAKVKGITRGPAVTRYELEMPSGATVKRIEGFSQDIAYALASNSGIRIEAPIPGKRAVGVEVPNRSIGIVALKDLISSAEFNKNASPLTLCIGKDIGASTILCNLEKMPHLLIAGSTGSGKSACLHSLIVSMLYKSSPADLRLLLIDPKRVEFPGYKNLPHLLINEVLNEREHVVNALKWARDEMEARYRLLAKYNARNIQEYNMSKTVRGGEEQKMPYIVIIIDELSDLMISESKKEIEEHITSIAQKARAAGMHLILATQRPSVNVITGTIKVNFPSRIAFAVSNGIDSKTILDRTGAEMLLGRGDLLYSPIDYPDPSRVQGSYVVKEEVDAVVDYIIKNNQADFDEEAAKFILKTKEAEEVRSSDTDLDEEYDVLLEDVARKVIETNQASAVMLQRRFKLGYARASRILDQMEQLGFIGPLDYNRTKPREIFITKETFREFFGKEY